MEPSKRLAIKTRDVTKRAKRAVTSVFVGMLVTGVHRRKASPGIAWVTSPAGPRTIRVRYLGIAKSIDSSIVRNYPHVLYRANIAGAGPSLSASLAEADRPTSPVHRVTDPREPQKLFSF